MAEPFQPGTGNWQPVHPISSGPRKGRLVPRRGLEPPRLAALAPEASASTNSAIWADSNRKSARYYRSSRRRARGLYRPGPEPLFRAKIGPPLDDGGRPGKLAGLPPDFPFVPPRPCRPAGDAGSRFPAGREAKAPVLANLPRAGSPAAILPGLLEGVVRRNLQCANPPLASVSVSVLCTSTSSVSAEAAPAPNVKLPGNQRRADHLKFHTSRTPTSSSP